MFKKKIWKRGDKLTVKELNRIEDGIKSIGGIYFVPFSLDLSTGTATTTANLEDALRAKNEGKILQAIIDLGYNNYNVYAPLVEFNSDTLKFEIAMTMNGNPVINRFIWTTTQNTGENSVEFISIKLVVEN